MFAFLLYALLLIDAAGAFILLYALLRIAPGATRRYFLFFMAVSLLWINSMFLVQLPALAPETAQWISRLIFAFGILAMHAYGYFVIHFCDRREQFRSFVFLAFMANQLLLFVLLGTGWITAGLRINEAGLRSPVYGPAHPWFVLSWIAYGAYVFSIGYGSFRRARDPVFRFQIRYLFHTGVATFVFMVTAIGVLPVLTRLPFTSYAGAFGCLILFWGIINLLVNERSIVIRHAMAALMRRPAFHLRENVRALYRALYTIGRAFETGELDQRIAFAVGDAYSSAAPAAPGPSSAFTLRISRGEQGEKNEPFRRRVLNLFHSEKYITGLIESQKNAQKENLRLALKVEELSRRLRETVHPENGDAPRVTESTLRILAAEIDPEHRDLDGTFELDLALNSLSELEFNELILVGLVEPVSEVNDTYRLAPSAIQQLTAYDDRPALENMLKQLDPPFPALVSRTHAPRWHLADRFAAGGGGCARVLRIDSEDALGEPEEFHELKLFRNVGLHYGYQGNELSLCETREPYRDLLKALVYDIFIGDGTYQFDCFHKHQTSGWTRIRIEFIPGLTESQELDPEDPGLPREGVFLLEDSRSSFVAASERDDRGLTVAVREHYRKLGNLGGLKTAHFTFQLESAPDDFVLYIGNGRTLQKLDLERTGERSWEGAASLSGLVVRAVLSSENMRDFGLVVTREPPGNSAN